MITAYILSLPTSYLTAQENLVLHYNRPAEFFEEALVIGNGTMGAILYGGTDKDVLYLNDITLWTGEPDRAQRKVQGHYSENYQPLGQLSITYSAEPAKISHYQRTLDISRAMARTAYQRNGADFACDYFASAPDSVIVLRLQTESAQASHSFIQLAPASCHYGQRQ